MSVWEEVLGAGGRNLLQGEGAPRDALFLREGTQRGNLVRFQRVETQFHAGLGRGGGITAFINETRASTVFQANPRGLYDTVVVWVSRNAATTKPPAINLRFEDVYGETGVFDRKAGQLFDWTEHQYAADLSEVQFAAVRLATPLWDYPVIVEVCEEGGNRHSVVVCFMCLRH